MAKTPLRVAVLGDSVMWGQGLDREDTYARIVASRMAGELDRTLSIVQFSARSGAKISAGPGEAERFVATYPSLASSTDEVPQAAARMFGDLPQTFPTVEQQLDRLIERRTPIDVLFIDGGANDLDFEEILNPQGPHDFVASIGPDIQDKVYQRISALLRRVRDAFPHTTVIVPGYFAAVSNESNTDRLGDLFEHMSGEPAVLLHLNAGLTFIGMPIEDIDRMVDKAVAQGLFGHSRGLYWLHRAVAEINAEPATTTPMLFCHSAFHPRNALFAEASFVHDDYTPEAVHDALAEQRQRRCIRVEHMGDMARLRFLLADLGDPDPKLEESTMDLLQDLAARLDGPASLVEALHVVIDRAQQPGALDLELRTAIITARDELAAEIARIERCLIASFLHPNAQGAARYAERITARWRASRATVSLGEAVRPLAGATSGSLSVRSALQRYGLDPASGLRSLTEYPIVDSVAIGVETREDSTELMFDGVELELGGARWALDPYPEPRTGALRDFLPGSQGFFTFDTVGELALGDIGRLRLTRTDGPGEDRGPWRPARVDLHLNGVRVFRSESLAQDVGRGDTLTLPYPTG